MGARGGGARGRRDPPHEHGPRRHRRRLRAFPHSRRLRLRGRASDRLRRRWHARSPGGSRRAGRRRRRAVRLDLPLRSPHGARGEGTNARGRNPGPALMPNRSSELRERVRRVPGMERLLPALDGLRPAYLVGGGVRDLLRGADPVDVDIAVEGDARSAARAVADRLGSGAREFERFGTATVETREGTYNFAGTRRETYDAPGELPRVEPASLDEDLRRRDFSINAMAL